MENKSLFVLNFELLYKGFVRGFWVCGIDTHGIATKSIHN